MKELSFRQVLSIILICLLCLVVIAGAIVSIYYDELMSTAWQFAGDMLSSWKQYDAAHFCYGRAIKRSGQNADAYEAYAGYAIEMGDMSLSERILSGAIEANPDRTDFYLELAKLYYEQDKLLDIALLIDSAKGSAAYDELNALRPAPPAASFESGTYSEHISVTFSSPGASVCVSSNGDFPSVESAATEASAEPTNGLNSYITVAVNEHFLVSEQVKYDYILEGVSETVLLSDPVFDAFIKDTLGKDRDAMLTTLDIWGVSKLTIPSLEGAASFEDLRMFTGLSELTFASQQIADWSFLAELTALTKFSAAGCGMTAADLVYLSALPRLRALSLEDNQIASVEALSTCANLKTLDLSGNSIHDISPLAELTGLLQLDISGNAVTSIDALAGMTKLNTLDCSYLILSDISALEGKSTLANLTFDYCSVEDISPLEGCTNLRAISCDSNQILSLDPLAGCTKLETIKAARNRIRDIHAISLLEKLTYADLTSNLIDTLPEDLSALGALSELLLANNNIKDLQPAKDLARLEIIDLEYNNVSSLEPLESCTALSVVKAFGNSQVLFIGKLEEMGVTVYR